MIGLLTGVAMICQVNTGNRSDWYISKKQKACQIKLAECLIKTNNQITNKLILTCIKERK